MGQFLEDHTQTGEVSGSVLIRTDLSVCVTHFLHCWLRLGDERDCEDERTDGQWDGERRQTEIGGGQRGQAPSYTKRE